MNLRKNVLFVSHYAGRTGAPMVLLHFLQWLKEHSPLSFEVFLREGGALEPEFAKLAVIHNLTHTARRTLSERILHRLEFRVPYDPLEAFCKKRRWDLIYSNTITNGELIDRVRVCGCPVITHIHEMDYWIQRSGQENWQRVKRQTTHFIAASAAVKDNLLNRHDIPEEKVSVVHAFVQVRELTNQAEKAVSIRQQLGIPNSAFVLGGSGAEHWRKGRDLIVLLLMALKRRAPDTEIHFLWVGHEGNEAQKIEFWHDLNQAGVADYCHVTGEVSNPLDYFAAMDVFVLLSREDPFPLVCLEAATLGKPLLCFAGAGGIPELIEQDSGFVVPYLDLEIMAEKVMFLSQHKDECLRMGKCGKEKIENRFSLGHLAPKILEVIEKVMGKVSPHDSKS